MKRIMTLLITLMSAVPAFAAVNANSSWEEIVRDRDEIIVIDRDYLWTPINYTHEVENCFWNNNQRRCKIETVTGSYPMTVTIPVYKRFSNSNVDRETLMFRKSYTVPQCDTPTVD